MDCLTFQEAENWLGSYHELAMELHPAGDDERLLRAVKRLWEHRALTGPWTEREGFGAAPAMPASILHAGPAPCYGAFALRGGREIGCVSHVVREEGGSDWLTLSLPTAMLGLAYRVAYPLTAELNPWLVEVDEVLLDVAEWLHAVIPFELAIVGEEVSGLRSAVELQSGDLGLACFVLPRSLWDRMPAGVEHRPRSHDLRVVPAAGA